MKIIKENIGQLILSVAIIILALSYLTANRYKITDKYIIDTLTSKVYDIDAPIRYMYKIGQHNK